jgi:hypothetical protein
VHFLIKFSGVYEYRKLISEEQKPLLMHLKEKFCEKDFQNPPRKINDNFH